MYVFFQTENPERLPQITASLFQSPGGRKFLNFISSLTRFVVLRHLKKQPERQPLWENVARPSWPLAKTLLPQLITDNNESSQREFKSLVGPKVQLESICGPFTHWPTSEGFWITRYVVWYQVGSTFENQTFFVWISNTVPIRKPYTVRLSDSILCQSRPFDSQTIWNPDVVSEN